MKIIGNKDDDKELRKHRIVIGVTILSIIIVIIITVIIGMRIYQGKKIVKEEEVKISESMTTSMKTIGIKSEEELKKHDEKNEELATEFYDMSGIGMINDGRYGEDFSREKLIEEASKSDSSNDKDLGSIPILIAASTLEVRTTIDNIKTAIDRNTTDSDEYNGRLLTLILSNYNDPNEMDKSSGIDEYSFEDFMPIVRNWLYFHHDKEFSWKKVQSVDSIYKSIMDQKLYEKDFTDIQGQILTINNEEAEMDNRIIVFDMVFTSNGVTYKGIFTIENEMPRLLDLSSL